MYLSEASTMRSLTLLFELRPSGCQPATKTKIVDLFGDDIGGVRVAASLEYDQHVDVEKLTRAERLKLQDPSITMVFSPHMASPEPPRAQSFLLAPRPRLGP